VVSMITNSGYLDGRLFRDMRRKLLSDFRSVDVLNLHGSSRRTLHELSGDENVFDIMQGVAITRLAKGGLGVPGVHYSELLGSRSSKYQLLQASSGGRLGETIEPEPPLFRFVPVVGNRTEEYEHFIEMIDVFGTHNPKIDQHYSYGRGFATRQDDFAIAFSKADLLHHVHDFLNSSEKESRTQFGLCTTKHFSYRAAKQALSDLGSKVSAHIEECLYRPFDPRPVLFLREVVAEPRLELMQHFTGTSRNIALLVSRQLSVPSFHHVLCARLLPNECVLSNRSKEANFVFPLMVRRRSDLLASDSYEWVVNLAPKFLQRLSNSIGRPLDDADSPLRAFHYVYAVLHSPAYRGRYRERLKSDFARIPLPGGWELFNDMVRLGSGLVSAHLMESPAFIGCVTEFVGGRNPEVEKVSWSKNTVWIDKAQTTGFKGVREEVWNFHIGGYQVCEKWLKDRKGRTLSKDDIAHYQKIVVALAETIRLMKAIDEVIEQRGGWPGAFSKSAKLNVPA